MERVLLLGYFGAGNFGDEALLAEWLLSNRDWLKANDLAADVTCAGDGQFDGWHERDILLELTGEFIPKRRALKLDPAGYRALIAPGGSLLQDVTSLQSLLYYLWMIRRFAAAGRPVYLLNQGLGPLNSWLACLLTPRVLNMATMLSLRDAQSHDWCLRSALLAKHSDLHLAADPILAADFAPVDSVPGDPLLEGGYVLTIPKPTGDLPTPRDTTTEAQALSRLLVHSAKSTGLKQVLLPLHAGRDELFCEEIVQQDVDHASVYSLDRWPGQRMNAIWTLVRGASLVISYRLHGLVAAASLAIPCLGVAYDPKITAFSNEIGCPYCYPATVHEEDAINDLARLWRDRLQVSEHMQSRRRVMLQRLEEARERFRALW